MKSSNDLSQEPVALIGYGYWGKKLYQYLKESNRFQLKSIFFPSLKKYDPPAIAKNFGNEFTPDLNRIWEDQKLSCVVIASPAETHYEVARAALLRGKNVLIEKPLASTGKEAFSLARLATEHHLVLETDYTYTYSKALKEAQGLIQKGAIGEIRAINMSFHQLGRFLPEDVFLLLGSHALSILDLFIPIEEFSFKSTVMMKVEGTATAALISFSQKSSPSPCQGYIDINLHGPKKARRVVIYGSKGTIAYLPDQKENLVFAIFLGIQSKTGSDVEIEDRQMLSFDENNNLRLALDHFYDAVKNEAPSNLERATVINGVLDQLRK